MHCIALHIYLEGLGQGWEIGDSEEDMGGLANGIRCLSQFL